MRDGILQDWSANGGNLRSQFVLAAFRFAQKMHRLPRGFRWLGIPYLGLYQLLIYWELGIELNYKAEIGPRLRLHHGYALVIHDSVVVGADCVLRHCTTLGSRRGDGDCPSIGDRVNIGCNSVIIGAIKVGDDANIGAGSVVIDDVVPHGTVAGNPARPVRIAS